MTLSEGGHRPAIDLKIETEIPAEVRRSIDGEAARWDVISPEVTSASMRNRANEYCAPEDRQQKNIPREAEFRIHADIVTIERGFRQQVAAEALKNL